MSNFLFCRRVMKMQAARAVRATAPAAAPMPTPTLAPVVRPEDTVGLEVSDVTVSVEPEATVGVGAACNPLEMDNREPVRPHRENTEP